MPDKEVNPYKQKPISYRGKAIYWYLRSTVISGVKELFKIRFLPFTILLLILSIISTLFPNLAGVEAAMGLALIFGQLWLVIPLFFLFIISYSSWSFVLPAFFYVWFSLMAFILLMISRDFVDSWAGYIFFLGEVRRVPYTPIFNAIFGIGIGISLVFVDIFSVAFILISMFMIYIVNVFAKIENNNLFATIISIFYIFILYNFAMMKNVARQFSGFFGVFDILFIVFSLFFIATKFIKPFQPKLKFINSRMIVYSAMGIIALFYVYTLNTNFFQSMHTILFISLVSIMSASLLLYYISPAFHNLFSRKPTANEAVKQAATTVANEFFGQIFMKVDKK
jgi:hypothetical protein